jgi:hypothetical protein
LQRLFKELYIINPLEYLQGLNVPLRVQCQLRSVSVSLSFVSFAEISDIIATLSVLLPDLDIAIEYVVALKQDLAVNIISFIKYLLVIHAEYVWIYFDWALLIPVRFPW